MARIPLKLLLFLLLPGDFALSSNQKLGREIGGGIVFPMWGTVHTVNPAALALESYDGFFASYAPKRSTTFSTQYAAAMNLGFGRSGVGGGYTRSEFSGSRVESGSVGVGISVERMAVGLSLDSPVTNFSPDFDLGVVLGDEKSIAGAFVVRNV